MSEGPQELYFVDKNGTPFSGNDVIMKVIRSGRRNISNNVSEITSLSSPLVNRGGNYSLLLDSTIKVVSAMAGEYAQFWKVEDHKKLRIDSSCSVMPYAQYAGTGKCGPYYYSSKELRQSFPVTCPRGYVPGPAVEYVVPAGAYSSVFSQADADSKAASDMTMNGQDYATANAVCKPYFYSDPIYKPFTKACPADGVGSIIVYFQTGGTDSSLVSQEAANTLGMARANVDGQAYANTNGVCTFYNQQQTGSLTKKNCPSGSAGTAVAYVIPAATFSSEISLADANAKAMAAAQDTANLKGKCIWSSAAINKSFTRNNCPPGSTGSSVPFSANQGAYTSEISQADADAKAEKAGQDYANANGRCSTKGTIQFSCSDRGCTEQGTTSLRFTFDQPTQTPITLRFGTLVYAPNNGRWFFAGSELFTPPSYAEPSYTYWDGNTTTPIPGGFTVTIPAGVTTYTTTEQIRIYNFTQYSWICHSCYSVIKEFYVKSFTDGFVADFTIVNPNVIIHNVQ
jgi:hypothetical protein